MPTAETEGAAIVLVGSFNPAIFQPQWLVSQNLVTKQEADHADIKIIQPEVTDFSTQWFQLQVLANRFLVQSSDPREYSPLRDLAAGMFTVLSHTPTTALGITRNYHYRMPSIEKWHALGHLLAPKESWIPIVDQPGLRSMVMQGQRPQADSRATLFIKCEPSVKVEYGIFIEVHEEHKPLDPDVPGSQWIQRCLTRNWDEVMTFADRVAAHIIGLVA
jgi:hypothetical protein